MQLRAAGAVQVFTLGSTGAWMQPVRPTMLTVPPYMFPWPLQMPPYGDEPSDQEWIVVGQMYYQSFMAKGGCECESGRK